MPLTCAISVCVPTYNRPELLERLVSGFGEQTFSNFELVFIDDGSSVPVEPVLRDKIRRYPCLKWRCVRVPNGGRARALNLAFDVCRGELVVIFDDDDVMLPKGLEALWNAWNAIPAPERAAYCGVVGLCSDPHGAIIGDTFPDVSDTTFAALRYVYGVRGDKKEAIRRDLLAQFRFRVYPGERRCPTSSLFLWLSQSYRVRAINVPCAVKECRVDGLSRNIVKVRRESARTTQEFYGQALIADVRVPLRQRILWASNLQRFRLHRLGLGWPETRRIGANLVASAIGLPVGTGMWLLDRARRFR